MDDKPNAPMTPWDYVTTLALPTLHEFLAERDDRRRAYLACLVIYHCADALGLAQAARESSFAGTQRRTHKRVVDAATDAVRIEAHRRCGEIFQIVQDIANGTKHPGKLPLLPGSERRVQQFAFTLLGAGFSEGRWGAPGLALDVGGQSRFLDECVQQVLAALVCAYPAHLGGVSLAFMDPSLPVPGLDMPSEWIASIAWWAGSKIEVAEVWLFGSRAKGTAHADSDVDLGIVLVRGEPGHDWPEGNYQALGDRWQAELASLVRRHVSLVAFGRPGEAQTDEIAAARAPAILLWTRARVTDAGLAALLSRLPPQPPA